MNFLLIMGAIALILIISIFFYLFIRLLIVSNNEVHSSIEERQRAMDVLKGDK